MAPVRRLVGGVGWVVALRMAAATITKAAGEAPGLAPADAIGR